jgi:hypothetical protein
MRCLDKEQPSTEPLALCPKELEKCDSSNADLLFLHHSDTHSYNYLV